MSLSAVVPEQLLMCVIGKVLTISARTAFLWIGISLPDQPGPPDRAVDRVVALAFPTATRTPTIDQKVGGNMVNFKLTTRAKPMIPRDNRVVGQAQNTKDLIQSPR